VETCGGGVNHQIHGLRLELIEPAAAHRPEVDKFAGERAGALGRTVRNHDFRGIQRQQRPKHAARRAARAQNHHALMRDVQTEVIAQVAHQTRPVGVVA
jgi:hypothetical protein